MTHAERRPADFSIISANFFEAMEPDGRADELWLYTDRLSYAPGETVDIQAHSTVDTMALEYGRDDGQAPTLPIEKGVIVGSAHLPTRFWETGCGWPTVCTFTLPDDVDTGFYLIRATAVNRTGAPIVRYHGFFVKAGAAKRRAILIAATSTWQAYNDWGGANAYALSVGRADEQFATTLSIHRPWAAGFMALDPGAPRKPHRDVPPPGAAPRYPPIEHAYATGLSKWYANAGWATYERPFCIWAEAQGFAFDYATQHDLDADPALLDDYDCTIVVGHDEYWSWAMRDAIDRFVDRGGNFARFGGNIAWQVRLENGGARQVCFKDRAEAEDSEKGSPQTTTLWDDPVVGRPPQSTFGLSTIWGIYAGVGGQAARGPGGFTVYRPDHWAFNATDLGYGDMFGQESRLFGYEVDGLDYVVRDGLPYPVENNAVPQDIVILAMGLTANTERGGSGDVSALYYGDTAPYLAKIRYGVDTPEAIAAAGRGSGMIVTFSKGAGQVFNAGSSEWVAGLIERDPYAEQITRNVLNRFGAMAGR